MASRGRGPSRNDIEIERLRLRYRLATIVVVAVCVILVVLASTFPLQVLRDAVKPFAGKKTEIDLNLVVGITAGISITTNILQFIKGMFRRREIRSQRQTITDLEAAAGIPPSSAP